MTATLMDIQNKVRRITKKPSQNQLTTDQLNQYINTFYLYDFPEHLRLKDMLTNYTFTTQPNQEKYALPIDPESILSNADPAAPSYTSIEPPVYIAGYQSYFTQSQENFYRLYPPIAINDQQLAANGVGGPYNFTLSNYPVMQNRVVISVADNEGNNLVATDKYGFYANVQIGDLIGTTTYDANNPATYYPATNFINYVTGQVSITYAYNDMAGAPINCQIVPYQASRPSAMLFFQNNMYLRPIPDASYQVEVQAYQTFTSLIASNQVPYIKQWWQFIALGTALKIFEDVGDFEAIEQYRPLFEEQRMLSERRTLVEQANERACTIYSEQSQITFGNYYGAL